MQKRWTWLTIMMIILAALAGCSDDDDPVVVVDTTTAYDVLATTVGDYINSSDCPGVLAAADLEAALASYTIVDLRDEDDFDDAHIAGAYHSTLSTLVSDVATGVIPDDKWFVVTCYTGQRAGYGKLALELMDESYTVYSLKFGMCAWDFHLAAKWDGKIANQYTPIADVPTDPLVEHDFPTLTENDKDTIVMDRLQVVLEEGLSGVLYADIANLTDYFIVNYWGTTHYATPGHLEGAYQFTPRVDLAYNAKLNNLPSDGTPILVYCYSGQTSAQVTGYLRMLGYDAYSLYYGANNLFYDLMPQSTWVPHTTERDLVDENGDPVVW